MSVATTETDGSWIWLPDTIRRDNRRVFFRREFILPTTSEFVKLQISALPFYHVYLNGEHVGYGPSSATFMKCFVDSYDVTQFLVPGINTLALIVMDQDHRNWHTHPYPPKVWCRLMAGDTDVVHTDQSWKVREADCYLRNQPRCHSGRDEVEKFSVSAEFSSWSMNGYDDRSWQNAREVVPFSESVPKPVFSGIQPFLWTESETFDANLSGNFTDSSALTFFSYGNFNVLEPGNYAAETFACSPVEKDVRMEISSDDPFVIFLNDDPVASRSLNRNLDLFEQPNSPGTGEEVLQSVTVHLRAGWNRFLCFQQISAGSMGMMLLFPQVPKSDLVFRRDGSMEALSGWRLCGPLRTPLDFSSASFSMQGRKNTVSSLPLPEHINDISAYLGSCEFTVKRTGRTAGLHEGEFAVYDLGEFRYGFPILDIDGTAGDIVDITCGLRLTGNAVRSIGPLGRMTDTLLLDDGVNSWMRLTPRGARYIMISVRKAASSVAPTLRFSSASSELGRDSEFFSTDETCNAVWEQALASLRHCVNQNIIDDPCGRRCQTLPEAYVYSRTLNYLFGGQEITERALKEFSEAQLENGMILKIVPSGVYSFSADTALLWILWLENLWDHTGNTRMLESQIPCLDRLLKFFRMIPPAGDVLLPSGRTGHCAFLNENFSMAENGIFIPLNALYYRALIAAAKLYGALNQDPREQCLKTAQRLADEIRHYARNPETGLYSDCYDGTPSAESSFRTNIMILNAGIVEDIGEAKKLLDACCSAETAIPEIASPFFSFVLETVSSLGRLDLAFEIIRTGYEYNRERMELYERGYNPHTFNIAAGDFLIREVLGVRSSAPGFLQIYFNPACSFLDGAKCRLPAAKGKISVEWKVEQRTVLAKIDSASTLDVLPLIPAKYGANFELGNYVNLLDPNS